MTLINILFRLCPGHGQLSLARRPEAGRLALGRIAPDRTRPSLSPINLPTVITSFFTDMLFTQCRFTGLQAAVGYRSGSPGESVGGAQAQRAVDTRLAILQWRFAFCLVLTLSARCRVVKWGKNSIASDVPAFDHSFPRRTFFPRRTRLQGKQVG